MKFHKITVHANSLGVEFIQGVLMGAEAECFEIVDPTDLQELLDTQYVPFDYVDDALLETKDEEAKVRVYLADNSQGREKMALILDGIEALRGETEFDLGSLATEVSETDDSEWADNWKEFFHPLPIGEKFVVKPTWEDWEGEDRIILEIDPESSFGSGQHETTSLCLESLEYLPLEGVSILDMGCGSGILGIGALLLGAKDVLAVDIDKNAVDIAVKNAALNKVDNFTGLCGNTLSDKDVYDKVTSKKYGVILANIVADVIIAMAPTFKQVLEDDGTLICSGIISPRKGEVIGALLENGFALTGISEKNDWVAITCTKA